MNTHANGSLYVISAVSKDRPGLVHSVTRVLADLNVNIVDVDARSVRGHFSMFLVVDLSTAACTYEDMMSALKPVGECFDLGLRAEPYQAGRRKADKHLMILTVMGVDHPGIVAAISAILAQNRINIEKIKMIARGDYIAMELKVDMSEVSDLAHIRDQLYAYSETDGLDVSMREYDVLEKPKRVVVFDCDSTIIQAEVIDELAKIAGVDREVRQMTREAMSGTLNFNEAIRRRVKLLKGLTVDKLELLARSISLTPGTEELISALRTMGYKIAVISGGFSFFTNYLKERLNLDYVFANELEIEDGIVTGNISGGIIDAEKKGEILMEIARREGVSPDQVVAVGDGANDRFMLQNAGLAIAFNPKEVLKQYSNGMITTKSLYGLLHMLGVPDEKTDRLDG
jgi:phosphoserine phosphatase